MRIVELRARPEDSLDWENNLPDASAPILWHFDFGPWEANDSFYEGAATLALHHFSESIWPRFKDVTFGVCLYQGDPRRQGLSNWVTTLAQALADEIEPYLFFDASWDGGFVERYEAVSQFPHIRVAVRGLPVFRGLRWDDQGPTHFTDTARTMVVIPEQLTQSERGRINAFVIATEKRVVFGSERALNEEWEGIDVIHTLEQQQSARLERMLAGFIAAGGIRGRGI
ncbi:MAG: hypothetical protein RL235_689 [Chlamydiota bacterium]